MKNLMETLSLAEKILLLHYDNDTGARGDIGEDPADFIQALALATVFELVLDGRLQVRGSGKNTQIFAGDDTFSDSGKPVLDHVYKEILARQRAEGSKEAKPVDLYRWVSEQKILGERHEGMGIVYQRLLDEKIIELRDMNRTLTKSSSLARMRGEAIALSKRMSWNTRRVLSSWFGAVESENPEQGNPPRLEGQAAHKKRLVNSKVGALPEESFAEMMLPQEPSAKIPAQESVGQPTGPLAEQEEFQADFYIVQHPFPGEYGEIKLALRRRLNNALVSFVQLASVPQDPGVDRNAYKNTNSRVINNTREAANCMNDNPDFLNGVLELGGTMVPADIATIAAITRAAHIPNALFPAGRKTKDDVLTAVSEDLNARKGAFGMMGECARHYFSQDARQILSVAE